MTPTTFYRGTRNNHWIFMFFLNVYKKNKIGWGWYLFFTLPREVVCLKVWSHPGQTEGGVMVLDGILAWLYITFGKLDCTICLIMYTYLRKWWLWAWCFFPKICCKQNGFVPPRKCSIVWCFLTIKADETVLHEVTVPLFLCAFKVITLYF